MTLQMQLLPLFVEVFLTFVLMFWMAGARTSSIRRGEVRIPEIALGQPGWTEYGTKVGNAYHNQFQLPVLFYVLTILAIIARKADLLFVIMAWIFVLSRIAHVFVHTGTNRLPDRFYVFALGAIVLLIMWIIFAVRVLLGLG